LTTITIITTITTTMLGSNSRRTTQMPRGPRGAPPPAEFGAPLVSRVLERVESWPAAGSRGPWPPVSPPTSDDQLCIYVRDGPTQDVLEVVRSKPFELRVRYSTNGQDLMFFAAARKAAQGGAKEIAQELYHTGVSAFSLDSYNQTPLFYAAREGNVECARFLIENGALVNHRDKAGQSPLFYSVRNGRIEVTRLLLDYGAWTEFEDNKGKRPLDFMSPTERTLLMSEYTHGRRGRYVPGHTYPPVDRYMDRPHAPMPPRRMMQPMQPTMQPMPPMPMPNMLPPPMAETVFVDLADDNDKQDEQEAPFDETPQKRPRGRRSRAVAADKMPGGYPAPLDHMPPERTLNPGSKRVGSQNLLPLPHQLGQMGPMDRSMDLDQELIEMEMAQKRARVATKAEDSRGGMVELYEADPQEVYNNQKHRLLRDLHVWAEVGSVDAAQKVTHPGYKLPSAPVVLPRESDIILSKGDYLVCFPSVPHVPRLRALEREFVKEHALMCQKETWAMKQTPTEWCKFVNVVVEEGEAQKVIRSIVQGYTVGHATLCCMHRSIDPNTQALEYRIVGYIHVYREGRVLDVSHLKVDQDYQGRGLGSFLMAGAVHHATTQHWEVDRLRLVVLQRNSRAIRLYQKLGFNKIDNFNKYVPQASGNNSKNQVSWTRMSCNLNKKQDPKNNLDSFVTRAINELK